MTEGLDGYELVRVFLTFVIAGGLWEGDGRRDVLLVVKVGEWWQRTGRRDRGKGKDGVSRGRRAQTSVCFCSCFLGGREIEFAIRQGFYTFCNAVVIYGGWGAVAVGEPICLGGGFDGNGAVDRSAVVVGGGAGTFLGGSGEIGRSDRVRILQGWRDRETECLGGKR